MLATKKKKKKINKIISHAKFNASGKESLSSII